MIIDLSKIVISLEIEIFHYEFLIHFLYIWAKMGYAILSI